jgi:predicted RNA methylase
MRTDQNLQVINAIAQKNFNPALLEKYSGFGGIGRELSEYDYYKKLNSIIPKDEIAKIKETTKTAYYTPELLVRFIYKALENLGFSGGNILEPAAGNGAFIKHMPKTMRENSKILAIEPEPIAHTIMKSLYPDVKTLNKKFEDVELKPNSFDLVVGNPPYGSWLIDDKSNPDLSKHAIHHYFSFRGVRLLKENGILVFVINCYFMDNIRNHVRDVITKEGGSLLAAYRLPENVFQNAKVTTDIIFITKNKLPTKWQKTKPITIANQTKQINEYYINNPQNILGRLNIIPIYERTGLICEEGGNLIQKLKSKLDELPKQLLQTLNVKHLIPNLINKSWQSILEKSNNRLGFQDNHIIKSSAPNIQINFIETCYNNNPLSEEEKYYEINIFIPTKLSILNHRFAVEIIIDKFLKNFIDKKFQHKIFYNYKSCN